MKRITYIAVLLVTAVIAVSSCDGVKREPGSIYMPDMAYSRAYESYADRDTAIFTNSANNKGERIFYNNLPPAGTIKRGELYPTVQLTDTLGTYATSSALKNPFDTVTMSKTEMAEAGRLFNVNCGICHGAKGGGNGPIAAAGHVGGVANLTADAYVKMSDGTMFHSITYGKGVMGSYASQVTRAQRWMIIKYIRTELQKSTTAKASDTTAAMAKK
jgi:mono/diheme cytochrome c family protein